MFVEDIEGGGGLAHGDVFLGALQRLVFIFYHFFLSNLLFLLNFFEIFHNSRLQDVP